jgi:hypothetical protein
MLCAARGRAHPSTFPITFAEVLSAMAALLGQDALVSTFTAQGELSRAEVLAAYDDFLARGPTRLVLWDLTLATVARVPTDDVRLLAKQLARMGEEHPSRGRTAILCAEGLTFGLARMLGTFLEIEGFPGKVGVFRELKTARAWLTDEVAGQ